MSAEPSLYLITDTTIDPGKNWISFFEDAVRNAVGEGLLIGVSTHSLEEALEAERRGADLVTFGPVFQTPSKAGYGPPLGTEKLEEAAWKIKIDLYAIGGVDFEKAAKIAKIPLAGFAVIRAVMLADDAARVVGKWKSLKRQR